MWDKLLGYIIKATDIQPQYKAEHCLVVKRQVGGCTKCRDVCPHDAIRIRSRVEIDEIDCTGCGLCVQICPSEALESSTSFAAGMPLKCSQVGGGAQSVQCHTRLTSSDLLRLADKDGKVTLARGDCEGCKIGSSAVPEALEALAGEARALAELSGRELRLEVLELDTLDATDNPNKLSRRELMHGGWRSLQHTAADVLAPLDPGDPTEKHLPSEMQKHYRLIAMAKPEADTTVPWVLPRVAEGCIMCPVCTNVCPTKAFSREFEPPTEGSGAVLKLEPSACMGCNACAVSCPPKVISLDEQVSWGELSGGPLEMYKKG
ncbi:MAG: 4Fe-4S dicluster domain-containing protein [Deinococcota bacterium]|nr:4Fe-4S dicluster domain-containing protein [Deinococcota bacterium]